MWFVSIRRRYVRNLWPLLLAWSLALGALGETETAGNAAALLKGMRLAVSQASYKGIVSYTKDAQVESFQLFHSTVGGTEQERLVAINSPLREVVRNAEKVACYFPDTKTVFVENKSSNHSLLLDLPEDLSLLSRYYRMEVKGEELVAMRAARLIRIEPRDSFRYARQIWVDVESKLPLKFELLDESGKVVEQMAFTSLSIESAIPAADLNPSTPVDQFSWQVSQRETLPLESLHWTLDKVPDGFQLVSYTRLKRPSVAHSVEHILLSDGLSSVSVYIEQAKGDMVKTPPNQVGAIHTHFRKTDGHLVTVMGEVPAKTVQAIAHGLRYQDSREP